MKYYKPFALILSLLLISMNAAAEDKDLRTIQGLVMRLI